MQPVVLQRNRTSWGFLSGITPSGVAVFVLLYIGSLLITGYHVHGGNQSIQIPLVHWLNNPGLYPDDPFVATLPYYAAPLWQLVAVLNRAIPLEPLLFWMFLLERLLIIYAAGRLARAFVPHSELAAIGAMTFAALAPNTLLGDGTIVVPYFEQTGLAIPFFLLAACAFHEGRPFWWAVWLGIGFTLNFMYGTYALSYFILAFLLSDYRNAWRIWVVPVLLFMAFVLPTISLVIAAMGHNAANDHLWITASRVRFPNHLYPTTWSVTRYGLFAVLMFVFILILWRELTHRRLFRHGFAWSAIALLWLVYAFVAEWLEIPELLMMQPARATDLWLCYAGIASISALGAKAQEVEQGRAVVYVAAFVISIWAWGSGKIWPLLPGLAALAVKPVGRYVVDAGNINRVGVSLGLLILIAGLINVWGRAASGEGTIQAIYRRPSPDVEEIAAWARDSTSADTTFLVDPSWAVFRGLSLRPVFVTWKDGSAMLWDRRFVAPWTRRLNAIGFDITRPEFLDDVYNRLQDKQVLRLREQYRIQYWVIPLAQCCRFPVAFRASEYKVVRVQ